MITAIVLAAGKSERMGRPKALLEFRGVTFLERILEAIDNSPIDGVIVVVGHDHEVITKRIDLPAVVYNEDYELGMVTSLQAGIRALPHDAAGVAIFLVDHPVIRQGTLEALLSRFEPGMIILPVHKGRRGHPVLFSRAVFDELLALPSTTGANALVRRLPERVVEVEVGDPGILLDVDTPEHFKELQGDKGKERDL